MPKKVAPKKAASKETKPKVYKLVFHEEHLFAVYVSAPNKKAAEAWADQEDIANVVLDITNCKGTNHTFECQEVILCKDLESQEADLRVNEKGEELDAEH